MRREERVTVQGPVKEQQPNGMSHSAGGGGCKGIISPGKHLQGEILQPLEIPKFLHSVMRKPMLRWGLRAVRAVRAALTRDI